MTDSKNGTTCMWVRRVAELTIVREKQFHAFENNEIATKTEMVIVQGIMHVNNNKHSNKLRKQHSDKKKHEKRHKC